jgi:hypothetical protein
MVRFTRPAVASDDCWMRTPLAGNEPPQSPVTILSRLARGIPASDAGHLPKLNGVLPRNFADWVNSHGTQREDATRSLRSPAEYVG